MFTLRALRMARIVIRVPFLPVVSVIHANATKRTPTVQLSVVWQTIAQEGKLITRVPLPGTIQRENEVRIGKLGCRAASGSIVITIGDVARRKDDR